MYVHIIRCPRPLLHVATVFHFHVLFVQQDELLMEWATANVSKLYHDVYNTFLQEQQEPPKQ